MTCHVASGSRELDIRYYREEGRPLTGKIAFRFLPEERRMMYYGDTVDLFTLKNLGAITKLWRDTFIMFRDTGLKTETQYTVEYAVPEDMPVNLGNVSLLPADRSNPEFLV